VPDFFLRCSATRSATISTGSARPEKARPYRDADGVLVHARFRLKIANGDSPVTDNLFFQVYRPDKIGTDTIYHDAEDPLELVLPVLNVDRYPGASDTARDIYPAGQVSFGESLRAHTATVFNRLKARLRVLPGQFVILGLAAHAGRAKVSSGRPEEVTLAYLRLLCCIPQRAECLAQPNGSPVPLAEC
jgi:hypothetical protein